MSFRFSLLLLTTLTAACSAATTEPIADGENDLTSGAGQVTAMARVMTCEGPDASMELYLPAGDLGTKPVIGAYALDLSSAGKGKVLEPVRISKTVDGASIVVDQFTRGLPATNVPIAGGTVDFDQRFATSAACTAFEAGPITTSIVVPKRLGKFVAMRRVIACTNDDANMEVYIPESAWSGGGVDNVDFTEPLLGGYTLDLSANLKGKEIEPVHVALSSDKSAVIVDPFARKLPPTSIPITGGTVDFDQRFGSGAECTSFNE